MVTIAMPAFNEEHYIEACIRSVQAQDYPRDRIEILVADGRSTDRTREILAALAARRSAHPGHRQPRSAAGRGPEPAHPRRARRDRRAHGRPLRVHAGLRPHLRRDPGRDRRRQRRRRPAGQGQDRVPARAVRRPDLAARRRRRRATATPPPRASSTPCSWARSAARSSRRSASTIPRPSPTRTPSSTSASWPAAARSTCRRAIEVHYFPRDSFRPWPSSTGSTVRAGRARCSSSAASRRCARSSRSRW
jgi:hypothetical protein